MRGDFGQRQQDRLSQTWKSEENISSCKKREGGRKAIWNENTRAIFSFQEIKHLDESETETFQHKGQKVWLTG